MATFPSSVPGIAFPRKFKKTLQMNELDCRPAFNTSQNQPHSAVAPQQAPAYIPRTFQSFVNGKWLRPQGRAEREKLLSKSSHEGVPQWPSNL
jgi:hypothetical protein